MEKNKRMTSYIRFLDWVTLRFFILGLLFQIYPQSGFSENSTRTTYRGVASCASSNCHGSMSPRKTSAVLQNEYITWLKKDSHSQAWKTLLSPESKRIAWQLGIENPAQDRTCLQCHATLVAEDEHRSEKFRVEDGVGCESCHGAADSWISEHASVKTTHADNLQRGLAALEDPTIRAANCLSCHHGDQQRAISHRIYGAGHPRLSFELDTYCALQPYHWKEDQDYHQRKGRPTTLGLWYAGQIAAAERQLTSIKMLISSSSLAFPELSTFNCYSCHHSLESKAFLEYDYRKDPGHPPINFSAVEMVIIILKSLGNSHADRLEKALLSFSPGKSVEEMTAATAEISSILKNNSALPDLSNSRDKLLSQLVSYGKNHHSLYFETAEQIAMGIESVEASLNPSGKRSTKLDQIFAALNSPKDFKPQHFSALCQNYF